MTFNDLPDELVLETFGPLDGGTLARLCCVSRRCRDIIHGCTRLKYAVELWADGMVAHPNAEPTAVGLKALLARRAAWSNVDLITSATKTFEFDSFACSQELVHGVYAQQLFHYFTAIRIPSAADPSASFYLWQRADVGLGTLDLVQFAMDPTQDLVVFLYNGQDEISRLVCRRLSSLQPHPFAAVALLAFPNPWTLCHFAMEIADDIIAIFPQTYRLRLVLYDWRRGNIIHDVHFEPHIASFHFLTPRVFVLASRQDSGSIEIWSLGDDEPIQPVHVATLQLPSIVGGGAAMLRHVDIYSNPFLAYPTAGKPWSKSNERRLCAFCLRYRVGEDNNDWLYDLFVHSRYLLTYAARPGNQLETVAWDSWGPQHSRMLVREIWQMFRDMFRSLHGERVLWPGDVEDGARVLTILDFSPSARRDGDFELCQEPTRIVENELFHPDVITCLPYRRTQCIGLVDDESDDEAAEDDDEEFKRLRTCFLIDEDHIVEVNAIRLSRVVVHTIS